MTNLISSAIARAYTWLKSFQVKQVLSMVLVGMVFLTVSAEQGRAGQALGKKVDNAAHQIDSERPKTTREWNREARQTEDDLGDRVGNIVEESGQALKEFGGMYSDTAKRSTRQLKDQTARD